MKISNYEYTRPSASGEGEVFTRLWLPEGTPTAVIQIAHGMQEHAGRYDRFARALAAQGWAVCANDHIGHGRSAMGHLGTFALQPGGFDFLIDDMHSLMEEMAERFPGLPRVLFGHSMGSIASALYVTRHADVDALILMGTPAPNPLAGLAAWMARVAVKRRGMTGVSPLITKLADANIGTKKSPDPLIRCAWLTRDEKEILRAAHDPLFGKPFSASAYAELFGGLQAFGAKDWAAQVPHIPVLITAGAADPCGGCGKGPTAYADRLRAAGHPDVTLRLYDGAKHELLNETNRDEVTAMLIDHIRAKLPEVPA